MRLLVLSVTGILAGCESKTPQSSVRVPAQEAAAVSPSDSAVLAGPMGNSIRRGRAILTATHDSLPNNARSKLRCASCHLDAGQRKNAMMLTGVYARYPQYRSRAGSAVTLERRINDCFERSLNGRALDRSSPAMTDLVAYMWFISRGIPVDGNVAGQGLIRVTASPADTIRGRAIYAASCATCHAADGGGTSLAPPVWGPHSFNIGAGMARVQTAAGFIRHNMPFDKPGSLSDQDAMDVAGYLTGRSRPDYVGKKNDWPKGGAPPDVPYAVRSAKPRS